MKLKIRWGLLPLFFLTVFNVYGQEFMLKGKVINVEEEAVPFANVILFDEEEKEMVKTGVTTLEGYFELPRVAKGDYWLVISFIGLEDFRKQVQVVEGMDFGTIKMKTAGIQIETAVVKARRALVEVKPDKTVLNVEGTINSAGENALGLMRKAPGVLLDNNNNISVLGRSGVKIFINGKNLPLAGDDLTNYLENLSSEQIDRVDIITNPGAKYEAEGNAGIIDIILKKSKNKGTNGTISGSYGQGRYATYKSNLSVNSRSNDINIYANGGYNFGRGYFQRIGKSEVNGFYTDGVVDHVNDFNNYDARVGADYYLNKKNTIGLQVSTRQGNKLDRSINRVEISPLSARENLDSILIANGDEDTNNSQSTFNLNYSYKGNQHTLNVDADYGRFRNQNYTYQPNQYYDASERFVLSELNYEYNAPKSIDIYTFKVDYEQNLWGGKFAIGSKFSRVLTDNTYLFYAIFSDSTDLLEGRSNIFNYEENVYAAYLNYNRSFKNLSFNAGLRMETTDVFGELITYDPALQEDPVDQLYTDLFPSMGLSYSIKQGNTLNINYGRRLNRPNYSVLNPFKVQESELSFRKGNPFLKPEIVNNFEIGYTHAWRYNVKLSYSHTIDQLTRLVRPDEDDPRAGFLSWDNLASQDVFALNFALPFEFTDWWNAFFNISGWYTNNQADYGGGAVVDIQAWSYNIFSQQTFKLPYKFVLEISGRYSGPGVWGGLFEYEANYGLNFGVQRKFLSDKLNVKLAINDVFHRQGWRGSSNFNGFYTYSIGRWDSRRIDLNVSYKFGDSKIKKRERKTGIEEETRRAGD
jgi:iron complex outermembrane receptor protein